MMPRIVAISLQHLSFFDDNFAVLFTDLSRQADIQWGKEPAAALDLLQQSPAPSAVLITDAALTQRSSDTRVWEAILSYVRQGGTAIAMGHFSSFAKPNDIESFFAKAGLTWQVGAYHRTDVALNCELATTLAPDLSARYSLKALFLKGRGTSSNSLWPRREIFHPVGCVPFRESPRLDGGSDRICASW
ncbi:hypothetical protein V2G26_007148 [Clonostachys chloroleuca]